MRFLIILCVIAISLGFIRAESSKCMQPIQVGICYAAKPRYAYSRQGGCQLFTYGGCGGNDNNFDTYEDCERECLVPR